MDDLSELAEIVRAARRRLGYSQERIAELGGASKGWIGTLEAGTMPSRPKPATLERLAEVLQLDPARLLSAAGYGLDVVTSATVGTPRFGVADEPFSLVLPLYGPASSGGNSVAPGESIGTVQADEALRGKVDAAFVVRGNSVSAYGIWDGHTVYVKLLRGRSPSNGHMVLVESEGAYYCKIYRENKLGAYLESHEAGRVPEPFPLPDDVRLVGLVKSWLTEFRPLE